ncbi:hypothetical protein CW362_24075 [Streptomyces populi]|uniref:Uncharacterized protein n=1 Tax=Streptomyces populi TaxID=2058924 RepID=A0A2I0SKW7_9ACTN|nr:hypothetical protein [Streptomyces populi]PKT70544.1 hypothetical protein CW362_24075 [Streptomyces populi]
MGTDEHACPECGQPVATAVHRYKTLGVWAPRWGPGPCHNPDCAAYTYEPGQEHGPGQGHGQDRREGHGLPEEAAAEKT